MEMTTDTPAPQPRRDKRAARGRTVTCRPSPDQLAEIERRAAAAGVTPGGYVLRAALAGSGLAPRRRAPAADPATLAALQELRGEVGRLGNVVNQLARAAYLGQLHDGPEVGAMLLADVQQLANDLRTALRVCAGVSDDR